MKDADTSNFARVVLESSRRQPVVVDFWSQRCPPCQVLGPILEALEAEAEGAWQLVKIDVDANPQVADDYQVRGIPAVKAFVDGDVVDAFVGAWPRDDVRKWLADIVPSETDILLREAQHAEEAGERETAAAGYQQVLDRAPDRDEARLGLARVALAAANFDAAAGHLAGIADARWPDLGGAPESIWLTLEVSGFAEPADDTERRYQAAMRLADGGQTDAGLGELLALVEDHPDWEDGRAGRSMVRVIATLGEHNPRAGTWRSRLGRLLYR